MNVSLARCAAVWLATTGVCLAMGCWAAGDLHGWSSFDAALSGVAALALIGCAAWSWWVTTVVVAGAVRHRSPSRTGWAQRLVLAACGAVLVGGVQIGPSMAAPSHITVADDQTPPGVGIAALEGLSLPARTTGALAVGAAGAAASAGAALAPPPRVAGPTTTTTVRSGDSLWSIAERLLAPDASAGEITDLMHRLHDLNRAEIGTDPDLIHPGYQLRTPLGVRPAR